MALARRVLNTRYPCCGGRARIVALVLLPRETYERQCPRCGQRWDIERRPLRQDADMAIDKLEWETVR
jgi:transcription elongation factor Elf1